MTNGNKMIYKRNEIKSALAYLDVTFKDIADLFEFDPSYISKIVVGEKTNDSVEDYITMLVKKASRQNKLNQAV